ncbi:aldehyde dehydrogenase family protein, partial [Pseudomonas aeruginosa]
MSPQPLKFSRAASFQEEIFGPVVGVTTFKDEAEALAIA